MFFYTRATKRPLNLYSHTTSSIGFQITSFLRQDRPSLGKVFIEAFSDKIQRGLQSFRAQNITYGNDNSKLMSDLCIHTYNNYSPTGRKYTLITTIHH